MRAEKETLASHNGQTGRCPAALTQHHLSDSAVCALLPHKGPAVHSICCFCLSLDAVDCCSMFACTSQDAQELEVGLDQQRPELLLPF
jgi:hypothetical protein